MPKKITFNTEARDALKRGVDAIANAVKVTLGPKGRNVIIDKPGSYPIITKDGVSVAKEIFLEDPLENVGAQMLKQVASRTVDAAGDGTTTATVLAQAIITAGLKNVAAGANPMELKRGIDRAVKLVVAELARISQKVSDNDTRICQVATVSANDDKEIGELIADAMHKVGRDGVITVEEATGTQTTIEVVKGLQFDRGFIAREFVTDTVKMEAVLEKPLILLWEKKISSMNAILPLIEKVLQANRSLIIIAEDVDQDALSNIVLNKVRGNIKVVCVRAPAFGDRRKLLMQDMAIITGASLLSPERNDQLNLTEIAQLGSCDKVTVDNDTTTIVGGKGDLKSVKYRADEIRKQIKASKDEYEKEKLEERLAKLSGGVAVMYVGASTELEMKEKKDRIDDALHATRAAMQEGIVPGGGVAYIRAQAVLSKLTGHNDEMTGVAIIRRAIEEPLRQICANAGIGADLVVREVAKGKKDFGYNARTDDYGSMYEAGIIDPTKVARIALENAASVAGLMLTTECVLNEVKK